MRRQQIGFTLIELVLVIVILGILAATALPRFSDLTTQARAATVDALAGGLRSGAAIAHATQLARALSSGAPGINIDGAIVDFVNGYPSSETIDNMLTDFTGFLSAETATTNTFTKTGTTTNCEVVYTESVAGAFPSVVVASSGC